MYSDQDYGRAFNFMINNYGNLGEWYFLSGDKEKALENFKRCADLAVKYTEMPDETVHTSPLVKGLSYIKVKNENVCLKNRIYEKLNSRYKLSDKFRNNPEFKKIVNTLKD